MSRHPYTKAQRRRVALYYSKARFRAANWVNNDFKIKPFLYDDQDAYDCGNADCYMCKKFLADYAIKRYAFEDETENMYNVKY